MTVTCYKSDSQIRGRLLVQMRLRQLDRSPPASVLLAWKKARGSAKNHYSALVSESGNQNGKNVQHLLQNSLWQLSAFTKNRDKLKLLTDQMNSELLPSFYAAKLPGAIPGSLVGYCTVVIQRMLEQAFMQSIVLILLVTKTKALSWKDTCPKTAVHRQN